jgi:hypothetical protein
MTASKLKTSRVLYAVTRSEWYRIEAPDADTARSLAFSDGEQINDGDTTNVVDCCSPASNPWARSSAASSHSRLCWSASLLDADRYLREAADGIGC